VLVGFNRGTSVDVQRSLERAAGGIRARGLGLGSLVIVPRGEVFGVIDRLKREPAVRYAEPDFVMRANGLPNDPQFGLQWGLWNTGQVANGTGGSANDDEGAVPAWSVTTGSSSIVVAVADTGVEYTHPDLAPNVWSNPGGIGGCAAGTHGFDVLAGENPCDPMDSDTAYGGHGTHVAGIIGAAGNNDTGVTGVNWTTTILPVKWLDSNSTGVTSDLINALQMVIQARQSGVNIRVVNDSPTFVGTAYSQALSDEIDQLGANDILFVTPAGNSGQNDDATPRYPCDYDRPTEICVAATDQNNQLPSWANWGANTVDLAAPGNNIYSTLRNGSYGYISGSSMSAAEVSGAAALILSAGYQSATSLKADILNNVDHLPSLSGLVRTGGRLDICRAMSGCTPPAPSYTIGKTLVGASLAALGANHKRVDEYALTSNAVVSKLSVYLQSAAPKGKQPLEGVVYADSGGAPGALVAVTDPLTFVSTNPAGWYDLMFATPPQLTPGHYWIGIISGASSGVAGFRYDPVSGSGDTNADAYGSGPSDPFGSFTTDGEQMSVFATYVVPPPPPPTNTSVPVISGVPQVGQALSASNGAWAGSPSSYGYQWQRCDATGSNCAAITGATSPTYTAAHADIGDAIEVVVAAFNLGGSATSTSAPTATVRQVPPSNVAPPVIDGAAQVGGTLETGHGVWTGSPSGYSYQWERCDNGANSCVAIDGATSEVYAIANGDAGGTLEVSVTAYNQAGSTTATSAPTAPVSVTTSVATPAPPSNAGDASGTAQGQACLPQVRPVIRLSSSAGRIRLSGRVTLSATAVAPAPARVSSVQFLLDGRPLGRPDTSPPYRHVWIVRRAWLGSHELSARVADSKGGVATAAAVSIVVVGAPGASTLSVRSLRWRRGMFTLVARNLPRAATVSVELLYPRLRPRFLIARGGRLRARARRPSLVVLRTYVSRHQVGRSITVHLGMLPSVRIGAPAPEATISGTVRIVAFASDELVAPSVRVSVDGRNLGRAITAGPDVVYWRTTRARIGVHHIAAVATDPTGTSATARVTVTVSKRPPPTTCPAAGR
jgi:subtilisin family serine protease